MMNMSAKPLSLSLSLSLSLCLSAGDSAQPGEFCVILLFCWSL